MSASVPQIVVSKTPMPDGGYGQTVHMLSNASTDASAGSLIGQWVDVSTLNAASLYTAGSFTGTVNIEGCSCDNPKDSTIGYPLVAAPTAAGLVQLTMPIRYARIRMSGFSAGTVDCWLHGSA